MIVTLLFNEGKQNTKVNLLKDVLSEHNILKYVNNTKYTSYLIFIISLSSKNIFKCTISLLSINNITTANSKISFL